MTGRAMAGLLALVLALGVGAGLILVAATGGGSQGAGARGTAAAAPAGASPSSAPAQQAVDVPSASPSASVPATASPSAAPSAAVAPYTGPLTRQVPVLMYHRIADPDPGAPYPGLYVSPASFDAQMHALHDAGWRTITAGQLGAAMAANKSVPVRTFVVMFDDGYKDNFTAAFPILQRYGFVATFSVVAKGGSSMMTSADLAALVAAGMEVGNHTLDHKNVSRIVGAPLITQIEGGAARIESRLAAEGVSYAPKTFVYPSGHVGPAAVALLQKDGYTDAFTEVSGVALIGTTPPLKIPRIRVSRFETLAMFLASMPAEPPA